MTQWHLYLFSFAPQTHCKLYQPFRDAAKLVLFHTWSCHTFIMSSAIIQLGGNVSPRRWWQVPKSPWVWKVPLGAVWSCVTQPSALIHTLGAQLVKALSAWASQGLGARPWLSCMAQQCQQQWANCFSPPSFIITYFLFITLPSGSHHLEHPHNLSEYF